MSVISPLAVRHYTATSCAGSGRNAMWQTLLGQQSALKLCDFADVRLETWIGEVAELSRVRLPARLQEFDCRNNRLALMGLEADGFLAAVQGAIGRLGSARVGLFLGTSTSGILESELAYRRRDAASGALPGDFNYRGSQNSYSLGDFVRRLLGLAGIVQVISTACSSSAKVFCSAERMIRAGLIDAALVGGSTPCA